ncbi:MAG: preprotein translocase subunit SecY [Nanoarchaeota archaeon]|nr:MAG: preprotein translocase subunit SecY [Nanoarchaeota archaeon]
MNPLKNILINLPEVSKPTQKKLSFNEKFKWTAIVLVLFFVLGLVPLYGLGSNELNRFQILSIILGAEFGSILSLGIGPLVTASIVLQLLVGSKIINIDTKTDEGKRFFSGLQKITSVFFVLFESVIFVSMGGLRPEIGISPAILIAQLFVGGILVMMMDELVTKWGFGSGISLFIAAGVSKSIFVRLLSPFTTGGTLGFPFRPDQPSVGQLWSFIYGLSVGDFQLVLLAFFAVFFTLLIFVVAVYLQSMRVEIPLSFGMVRGHGIRWPLAFMYTSNIPVILVAALLANVTLWGQLLQNWGYPLLGTFSQGQPVSGFVAWITPRNLVADVVQGSFQPIHLLQSLFFVSVMVGGAVLFSFFWVQTSGMDSKSQAKQIMESGLQIPGFRRDERILENLLDRYITPLTIMGGGAVGILASLADLSGALTNGTGLLLTVMIIYKLYEEIAQQHMMDMNPMVRRFVKQ